MNELPTLKNVGDLRKLLSDIDRLCVNDEFPVNVRLNCVSSDYIAKHLANDGERPLDAPLIIIHEKGIDLEMQEKIRENKIEEFKSIFLY